MVPSLACKLEKEWEYIVHAMVSAYHEETLLIFACERFIYFLNDTIHLRLLWSHMYANISEARKENDLLGPPRWPI